MEYNTFIGFDLSLIDLPGPDISLEFQCALICKPAPLNYWGRKKKILYHWETPLQLIHCSALSCIHSKTNRHCIALRLINNFYTNKYFTRFIMLQVKSSGCKLPLRSCLHLSSCRKGSGTWQWGRGCWVLRGLCCLWCERSQSAQPAPSHQQL